MVVSIRLGVMTLALALCAAAIAQPSPATAPAAGKAAKDSPGVQPTPGDDKDVIEASQRFLKLIDTGHYGEAWDGGAAPLKSSATRKEFVAGIAAARKPLGAVASRAVGQFARAHSLPGAPEGDYVIVSFETKFKNGKRADEQVIWMLDENDWRVSGYFIR
jgi:hypothetical protein